MANSWLSVNAKTTRTADISASSADYLGISFSGFTSLNFKINQNLNGVINLGNRNLAYTNISEWLFSNGSYRVTGNHDL